MAEPQWKTHDGRLILMKDMTDYHLAATIGWLERRGAAGAVMTPEELEQNPAAKAELLLSGLSEFTIQRYKELLAERRKREEKLGRLQRETRAAMAVTRPGQGGG